jgi:hypothetical protein
MTLSLAGSLIFDNIFLNLSLHRVDLLVLHG